GAASAIAAGSAAASVLAMHPQISAISGFQLSNSPIKTPDLNTTYDAEIPGVDQSSNSQFEFYQPSDTSSTGNPFAFILYTLVKGKKGFVVFAPTGNAVGQRFEVWPVIVTSTSNAYTLGNDPARFMVDFSVYARPALNGTDFSGTQGIPSGSTFA